MAFKSLESIQLARFNSANSCDFLDFYENAVDEMILEGEAEPPSRTFAPSSVRCKRISWFRIRGVEPEQETTVDRSQNFTAQMGTACHRMIQEILSKKLGDDWVDVETYLKSAPRKYKYVCHKSGFETQVEVLNPPIKFSPDGIIRFKGKLWLFEIKSSEHSSFEKMSDIKPQHTDQIKNYSTLLELPNVLTLYIDRMYGNLKCYESFISEKDMNLVWDMFYDVMDCVDKNIAPPKLPKGDPQCKPSMCRYYNKCKEW